MTTTSNVTEHSTVSSKNTKAKVKRGPILLPLDPWQTAVGNGRTLLKTIELLRRLSPADLQPVALLPGHKGPNGAFEKTKAKIRKSIALQLKKIAPVSQRRAAPLVLEEDGSLLESAVTTLTTHAIRVGASMIALPTSGRKGFRRLGSFTEHLITVSPLPVLAVNPSAKAPRQIRRIFLATDLSSGSRALFEEALRLVRGANGELILFHQTETASPYAFGAAAFDPSILQAYEELEQDKRREAQEWTRQANEQGFQVKLVASNNLRRTGEVIVAEAKKAKADLILLLGHHGRAHRLFLGSVTRDVLEFADRPVLIYRPSAIGEPSKHQTQ